MRRRRPSEASRTMTLTDAATGTARIAPTTPSRGPAEQHRGDRREARQLDRLAHHGGLDEVVLDLLVDQDDHEQDDRRRHARRDQRDPDDDERRDRRADLRDQVEQADDQTSTTGKGAPTITALTPTTVPAMIEITTLPMSENEIVCVTVSAARAP